MRPLLFVLCFSFLSCYRPYPQVAVPPGSVQGSPGTAVAGVPPPASPGAEAARTAIDLTGCGVALGLGPLSAYFGTLIDGDPDWRPKVLGALNSTLGPSIACALNRIVEAVPQDAPPAGPAGDTRPRPGVQLQELASQCPDGQCKDRKARAAWLLMEASRTHVIKLPSSGEH